MCRWSILCMRRWSWSRARRGHKCVLLQLDEFWWVGFMSSNKFCCIEALLPETTIHYHHSPLTLTWSKASLKVSSLMRSWSNPVFPSVRLWWMMVWLHAESTEVWSVFLLPLGMGRKRDTWTSGQSLQWQFYSSIDHVSNYSGPCRVFGFNCVCFLDKISTAQSTRFISAICSFSGCFRKWYRVSWKSPKVTLSAFYSGWKHLFFRNL